MHPHGPPGSRSPAVSVLPVPGGPCKRIVRPLPLPVTKSLNPGCWRIYACTMALTICLYSVLITSLLKAFSRKLTGFRSSTLTNAKGEDQITAAWKSWSQLTPFLVSQRINPKLRIAPYERILSWLVFLIHKISLLVGEPILLRLVGQFGFGRVWVLLPIRIFVNNHTDWLLQGT